MHCGQAQPTCLHRRGPVVSWAFKSFTAPRAPPSGRCVRHVALASKPGSSRAYQPSSAKDAIQEGTDAFNKRKDLDEAVSLLQLGLQMSPSSDEAMAAYYNLGCVYAKQRRYKEAAESIVKAINDYNLRLIVALRDDDLRELRDTREWLDALTTVKGGLTRSMKQELRAEIKAPFRLPRFWILGGLAAGAALGLLIITSRLLAAIQGGEGAPDLQESVQNFGINTAALAVLSYFLWRDYRTRQVDLASSQREEALSRLQIDMGGSKVVPLVKLRGEVRPLVLAGSRAFVEQALREAERDKRPLRERGIALVPLVTEADAEGELDPSERIRALKRELAAGSKDESSTKGFGAQEARPEQRPRPVASEEDRKWKLTIAQEQEWKEWITEQKASASVPEDQPNVWVQVQLDGTVRSSGRGLPDWAKLIEDLPPLDSIRTTLLDGIGTSV